MGVVSFFNGVLLYSYVCLYMQWNLIMIDTIDIFIKMIGNDQESQDKAEFILECKAFFHRFVAYTFLFLKS